MSVDALLSSLSEANIVWLLTPAICLVFLLGLVLPLDRFGLVPRRVSGLVGIGAMPFLHGDARHLWSNIIPLIVLSAFLVLVRGEFAANIAFLIQLLGGLLLWLLGRPANHIGASLLVFGLAGFHLTNGFQSGNYLVLAIAALVALLYGSSLVRNVLPWRRGTSWDGHLCGFIAGAGVSYTGITIG